MLSTRIHAASGEHLMQLDDEALAAIVGGAGPLGTAAKKFVELLWDCVSKGLDDVIDAAKEGYADGR
jgi:hypothetical protein